MSSLESAVVASESDTLGHFINGEIVSDQRRSAAVFNPATGQVTQQLALADQATVTTAVDAATAAFPAWRQTPPNKRAQILFRYKQLLEQNAEPICQLITAEHGKVIDDAHGELGRGIEVVDYACGISELLKGEFSKNAGPDIDSWSEFQPLGVVAGITPFNFPAMVPMWMFPMAIACGNTFILKPSERDPSPALLLAKLFSEAGLPDGVFNVVNGDGDTVQHILDDDRVQALSFVGSTPIAESLFQRGSACGKRVQALGGAKNHAVILPDADLENAVNALMGAAYGSCGERCMAISVAVCVGEETADKTVALLKDKIAGLKIGPGVDAGNDMGPLITKAALDRVTHFIAKGVEEGAELAADGRGLEVAGHESGFFIGASLFDRVTSEMSIYQDEIFGPVLCVVRVDSLDAAMELINAHEFGNGTCLFTRDGEAARYFTDHIQVGMVGVNVALPVPIASQSFGGWKRSLFGDLYVYGPDAVRFYTRRKTMTQRWPANSQAEKARYAFPSS
ncbi:MAG TPA: methylmalonate-semialdehyde dehydrogenase (CoA acylating) [Gammaproteobacteria bacterium]|nr:MAG: CoA-acylating methylmalonate-semialdehyde dehydrogenase [Gammaproteobacteria bacterium TMED163]HAR90194.1 methylmalonate-semialdehyde dehydrogenase (CoA acylating) [Gammaproteobacteria bacterium]HBJ91033.1 methylmalonate-semialdehyde dehydrogenase (CoA acylating) [Gammaproteobacteria bacterium]|tara:strand:+ start:2259 stop:3788 length:1530 start_codon:yes stop_codon:yes gene_type:complete